MHCPPTDSYVSTRYRTPLTAMIVAIVICVTVLPPRASADEILDYLPEDALGFLLIRDLQQASAKFDQMAQTVGITTPSMLVFLKHATGITQGLDENGNVLLLLIPGSHKKDPPEPVALLPASDYARLSEAVDGDPSGGICSVTIAGEEVLLAKMGNYALLMNMEHRETLEIILGLDPEPVELLKPWSDWLQNNDVALVMMPEGKKWLVENGSQLLDQRQSVRPGGAISRYLRSYPLLTKLASTLLQVTDDQLEAGAFGLKIDDDQNLVLGKRFLFERGHPSKSEESLIGPLTGAADEDFVIAGGIRIPPGLTDSLVQIRLRMMRENPELWQLQGLPEAAWDKFNDATAAVLKPVRSVSGHFLPGKPDDALLSNLFTICQTDDTEYLLELIKAQTEVWNETMGQTSSDIKLSFEIVEKEFAGCPALELSLDVVAAAKAEDVPQFKFMMDAFLGDGGTLRIRYVCVDDNLMITAIADQESLEAAIERLKQQERGLDDSQMVAETAKLMPSNADGSFYLSLQGIAKWITRLQNASVPLGGGQPTPIDLPASPPIGIAIRFPERQLSVDVIWPAAITEALIEEREPGRIVAPAVPGEEF